MCNNTKQKIAATLRQMMKKHPFQKISVQSLMDETHMKRQSFYYHFQDTRDVLAWICRQELGKKLEACQAPFSERILYALQLLNEDRVFYRQVINAAMPEFVQEFGENIFRPWIVQRLYPDKSQLSENETFVVSFITHASVNYFVHFVRSRDPFDPEVAREQIAALLGALGLSDPV